MTRIGFCRDKICKAGYERFCDQQEAGERMNGSMMVVELTIDKMLRRGATIFPRTEIVSRLADQSIHRYTFADFYKRTLRLMAALRKLKVKRGDRVATFAWNCYAHLEAYFAIPSIGSVLHTLNIRLFPEQLEYIVNHAEDKIVIVDKSLIKPLAALKDKFKSVKHFIIVDDKSPDSGETLPNSIHYEELLASGNESESWEDIKENEAAALCYTSGTTGEPKGVLYSHRSTYLHTMEVSSTNCLGIGMQDVVLPVVPMFHVNAWGLPFACVNNGAKIVFPGAHLIGHPLAELLNKEKVTVTAGVPTVWNALYHHVKKTPTDLSSLRLLIVGGSAMPVALTTAFEKELKIPVLHAWGMTELSPVGTVCVLKPEHGRLSQDQQLAVKAKQGIPVNLVEVRVMSDEGTLQPWDGKSIGELQVRGPWVASSYYKNDSKDANASFTKDGWFGTGDVVTMDADGVMQITDRKKDLIKTRGEWLSTVDMENALIACPGVLEAGVIGRPDEVRGEAVVAFIVPKEEAKATIKPADIAHFLTSGFAKWQIPKHNDIHFVAAIPKTSVGKIDKKALRRQLAAMG